MPFEARHTSADRIQFKLAIGKGTPVMTKLSFQTFLAGLAKCADSLAVRFINSYFTSFLTGYCYIISEIQNRFNQEAFMILQNLKNIREDHDIRQKTIAEYLGVSQNTYSQYENGVISISPEMLIKLGDYFDVSVDYLLGRTSNKKRYK